ncbi:concanavalin A-like lectin/glucanase domain-containing protein [Gautieria morchelliformis]|nr:concanavalin A-like lectin/glucanase domain-containing protein [Gautieria morchelliformis]
MLSGRNLSLALSFFLVLRVVYAQYQLTQEYAGSTFFDNWQFYDNFDNLTHGDAIFVSRDVASSAQLAYINAAGNAIIKVDNASTVAAGQKRNTVRIQTEEVYGVGSLWIADMTHVPFGCSVWGAWWSGAPNWPQSGEIDTFEGVNLVTTNQMALHTNPGCTLDLNNNTFSGVVNSTDCSYLSNSNQGCAIKDNSTKSYGEAFAAAGGGVFVTEFATKGISMWFFTRSAVPPSLKNITGSFNTSVLGEPTANYPSTLCDATFFEPQHLTFDITLCGIAGNPQIFAQTCSGICYDDYVIGPPSTYDNAYFEVAKVQAFHDPRFPFAQENATTDATSSVHVQQPGPTFLKGPSNGGMSDMVNWTGLWNVLMAGMACIMLSWDITL